MDHGNTSAHTLSERESHWSVLRIMTCFDSCRKKGIFVTISKIRVDSNRERGDSVVRFVSRFELGDTSKSEQKWLDTECI